MLERILRFLLRRDDKDWNVARRQIGFEAVEDLPAIHIRQTEIERDRGGRELAHQLECRFSPQRHHRLEAILPREIEQPLREIAVVLDDEHRFFPWQNVRPIVRERELHRSGLGRFAIVHWFLLDRFRHNRRRCPFRRRGAITLRQEERERAPAAFRTFHSDLAAKHARQLATDREAETGAAVLPARAAVRLEERFEDCRLFVCRNADAAIADRKRQNTLGAVETLIFGRPPGGGRRQPQIHVATLGKLERIRKQVFQDLIEPLRIGTHGVRHARIDVDLEADPFSFRDVPERPLHRLAHFFEADLADVERNRAGLDLG